MNKTKLTITISAIYLAIFIVACNSAFSVYPVLEQDAYYQKVGKEQATRDIKQIMAQTQKEFTEKIDKRNKDIEANVKSGAPASVAGTAVVLITGNPIVGTVTGSGTQAYTKIQERKQDELDFKKSVEKRLSQKGYQIKHWENSNK